jgi:hypothetical protein
LPPSDDRVPNDVLREAFLRALASGQSQSSIARNCDFTRTYRCRDRIFTDHPDVTYLKRLLGVIPVASRSRGKRYENYRRTVAYDDAVKIVAALGMDPHEVGV